MHRFTSLALLCAALMVSSTLWLPGASPEAQAQPSPAGGFDDHVLFVQLPADVLPQALSNADPALRNRLTRLMSRYSQERAQRQGHDPAADALVIFVDQAGSPVLPDLEAASSRQRRGFSAAAATGLTFTFNSPAHPWTSADMATLTAALDAFYPVAKSVYGDPAFSITVNVRQDPTISVGGLYSPSLNEMVLPHLARLDPLCHEMIHAFRDDNIVLLGTYEEGMTRTAEIEVFNQLDTYTHDWDEHHSYTYDVYYDALNTAVVGAWGGSVLAHPAFGLLRYQLAGYAWAKPLLENEGFLRDFNREYNARMLLHRSTRSTASALIAIAAASQPNVEGEPFLSWYAKQGIFNASGPPGHFVYQRINQFTVDVFERTTSGAELPSSGVTVRWRIFDYRDSLLRSGESVTSPLGWAQVSEVLPTEYTGRVKVVAETTTPSGVKSNVAYRTIGNEQGVFGVVTHGDGGSLVLTPLDDPALAVTVSVSNGAYSAPGLAGVRGRVLATHTYPSGFSISKQFTKDASHYFLTLVTPVGSAATDLVQLSVSPPPLTISPGGTFVVTDTARNGGLVTVPTSVTRYFLSADAIDGPDDPQLAGARYVPELPAGEVSTGDESVKVPLKVLPGVYFVLVCADAANALAEADETNNCVASSSSVTVARPDLVAISVSSSSAGVFPGAKFNVADTVQNVSTVTALETKTQYYFSFDGVKSGTAVLLAGKRAVFELTATSVSTGSATVLVPTAVPVGSMYLVACADDLLKLKEVSETNNCVASSSPIVVGWPDLVTTDISSPPVSAIVGGQFRIVDTVSNQGNVAAGPSSTLYYLSADPTKSSSDVLLTGKRSVVGLAPNASSSGARNVTIPLSVAPGTYFVLACADDLNKVPESINGNNCRASAASVIIRP
jgi:hypothetical protein